MKKKLIELKSNLLVLKELKINDVTKEYIDWLNNHEINKYTESRFVHQNKKTVTAYVKKHSEDKLTFFFGIFLRNGLKHIGNIKIGPINPQHNFAEIGVMIGDTQELGKGYGALAVSMVTSFGLNRLNIDKINAGCYVSNVVSKKTFIKCGYQVEGMIRNCVALESHREGVCKLGCTKEDIEKMSI